MKKIIPLIVFIFAQFSIVTAQETEVSSALRNSQNIYEGSARFMSMGGAFTALGADLSSISLNPAGIGVYTGFQLEFTPSFHYQQTDTRTTGYENEVFDNDEFGYNLNLNNFGLTGAYTLNSPGWKNINFGLGYNTLKNHTQMIRSENFNRVNSKMHEFVNNANNGNIRSAYEDLSWQTYLLNYDSTFAEYWSNVTDEMNYSDTSSAIQEIGVDQKKNLDNGGSLGEYFLSVGANYENSLYLGMSVGIQRANYSYKDTYTESERNDQVPDFSSMNFIQYENHSGTGYNFKLGAIYRPTDFIRVGAAFHSPTYFNNLSYIWYNTLRTRYDNGDDLQASSEQSDFSFKLTTPSKILGGVAFRIKEIGLISADYERVNYGQAKLHEKEADDIPFDYENDSISNTFGVANNLRLGGELKLNSFYVRAGYAFYQSPYKNDDYQSDRQQYSGGLGFRGNSFFIDAAYVTNSYTSEKRLFSTIPNLSEIDFTNNKFVLSLGFRF
ncbi:MAG: OmpP1/FadL family transporter [Bacteroidota bacterium]